jgi:hypothetical protein
MSDTEIEGRGLGVTLKSLRDREHVGRNEGMEREKDNL